VQLKVTAEGDNALDIHSGTLDGPVIAQVKVTAGGDWKTITARVSKFVPGIQNIVVVAKGNTPLSVDWIKFE
jgi:hypothetical protein